MRALLADPAYQSAELFQVWTRIKVKDVYGHDQEPSGVTASVKRAEVAKFDFESTTPEDFERFARAVGSLQVHPALH